MIKGTEQFVVNPERKFTDSTVTKDEKERRRKKKKEEMDEIDKGYSEKAI